MFAGFWKGHETCGVCGARFETGRGEFTGPVMFGQGVFALVAIMGWFVLREFTTLPPWVPIAWLLGFMMAPLLLYRNLKGAWVGLLFATMDGKRQAPADARRPR